MIAAVHNMYTHKSQSINWTITAALKMIKFDLPSRQSMDWTITVPLQMLKFNTPATSAGPSPSH